MHLQKLWVGSSEAIQQLCIKKHKILVNDLKNVAFLMLIIDSGNFFWHLGIKCFISTMFFAWKRAKSL